MQKILITGGTGSLGKALLRRLATCYPDAEVTIFSRDETKQSILRNKYPHYRYILGDVSDKDDLQRALYADIDTVFHLAAYKQVPSAENNVPATFKTNVLGSIRVINAAIRAGVARVVASSTDKACMNVNAYGASKALMEDAFQNANTYNTKTSFHLTRYGNVVSSSASVIPLFKKQRKAGGPITITDKRMTRFWLSIEQAVDLLFHALEQEPGVIVVPRAPALGMLTLAQVFAEGGLEIREIGIRPGEKLHESMVSEAESFHTTFDAEHYYIHPSTSSVRNELAPFSYNSDTAPLLDIQQLLKMVEEYDVAYA